MAPKSAYIFFAILLVVAVAAPIVAADGGWQPIANLKAPKVVAIAKFAVAAYSREQKLKTPLVLVSVLKGESQRLDVGFNYRLVVTANGGGAVKTYTTVVYDNNSSGWMSLVSFQAN